MAQLVLAILMMTGPVAALSGGSPFSKDVNHQLPGRNESIVDQIRNLDEQCCRRVLEDGGDDDRTYRYDCSDLGCTVFPVIPRRAVSIIIEGGDFEKIGSNTFASSIVKHISINNCAIGRIHQFAFTNLQMIVSIEFHNVDIGIIDQSAFLSIYFDEDTDGRFIFDHVTVETSGIAIITVRMPSGLVSVQDMTVHEGFFPDIVTMSGSPTVDIDRLSRQVLSDGLFIEDAIVNRMDNCHFDEIRDRLKFIDDDVALDWNDLRVPCNDADIQWLVDDPEIIRSDILDSLICHAPPELKGTPLRDVVKVDSQAETFRLPMIVLFSAVIVSQIL